MCKTTDFFYIIGSVIQIRLKSRMVNLFKLKVSVLNCLRFVVLLSVVFKATYPALTGAVTAKVMKVKFETSCESGY